MSTQPTTDGGPAFPMPAHEDHWGTPHSATSGMTLRFFAATQAMQGLIATRHPDHYGENGAETLARDAFLIADAMLAEGSKS